MVNRSVPTYIYWVLALGILGLILSTTRDLTGSGTPLTLLGGIIAGLTALGAVLLIRYEYLIIPLIKQRSKTIITSDLVTYDLSPSQDTIAFNHGNEYYASAFLGIEVYRSPTEEISEENLKYNEFFERAISSFRNVTKIGYLIHLEEIGENLLDLERKKNEAQNKLTRERQKPRTKETPLVLEKYQKELEIWDRQIKKIRAGKPMGVIAYAMVTSQGDSKDAAGVNAKSKAEEIRIAISNSLNVRVDMLRGDQLLKCIEWERFYPISTEELEAEAVSSVS